MVVTLWSGTRKCSCRISRRHLRRLDGEYLPAHEDVVLGHEVDDGIIPIELPLVLAELGELHPVLPIRRFIRIPPLR